MFDLIMLFVHLEFIYFFREILAKRWSHSDHVCFDDTIKSAHNNEAKTEGLNFSELSKHKTTNYL